MKAIYHNIYYNDRSHDIFFMKYKEDNSREFYEFANCAIDHFHIFLHCNVHIHVLRSPLGPSTFPVKGVTGT